MKNNFFQDLKNKISSSSLDKLVETLSTKSFKLGEYIYNQDDPANYIYIILSGSVY